MKKSRYFRILDPIEQLDSYPTFNLNHNMKRISVKEWIGLALPAASYPAASDCSPAIAASFLTMGIRVQILFAVSVFLSCVISSLTHQVRHFLLLQNLELAALLYTD